MSRRVREPRGPKTKALIARLSETSEGITEVEARAMGLIGPGVKMRWFLDYINRSFGYVTKTVGYQKVPHAIRPLSRYAIVGREV